MTRRDPSLALRMTVAIGSLFSLSLRAVTPDSLGPSSPVGFRVGVGGDIAPATVHMVQEFWHRPAYPTSTRDAMQTGFHFLVGVQSPTYVPHLRLDLTFDRLTEPAPYPDFPDMALNMLQLNIRGYLWNSHATLNPFLSAAFGALGVNGSSNQKPHPGPLAFDRTGIALGIESGIEVALTPWVSLQLAFGYRYGWIPHAEDDSGGVTSTDAPPLEVMVKNHHKNFIPRVTGFHGSATAVVQF